jgi:hypothetical protein
MADRAVKAGKWWLLPATLLTLGGLSFLIAALKDSAGALVVTGVACTTAGAAAAANARRRPSAQDQAGAAAPTDRDG